MQTRTATLLAVAALALAAGPASAQIRVNPTGVNVSSQGATTAFLTFGPLDGYVAVESLWCGTLVPAAPALGLQCDPATLFGALPARYDRSQTSATNTYTDVMSVPASVARRAYRDAAAGASAAFFYVRHFVKPGAPDQFVAVTCRLTAGGARVPLSLVDVQLAFDVETPVLQVAAGQTLPDVSARLVYTGTGRLKGRWEVVLPGQEPPEERDLLTEATLPADQRGTQHRFAEVDRFDVFLAPTGRFTLAGPDPGRLPTGVDGQYLLLLRIEVSDDKEADSELSAVGASGVAHAGGVAGFPMPVLRYVVGSRGSAVAPTLDALAGSPEESLAPGIIDLRWPLTAQAACYRVEIESGGHTIHRAFVAGSTHAYRLPPFVFHRAIDGQFRWRAVAVDAAGRDGAVGTWRIVRLPPKA